MYAVSSSRTEQGIQFRAAMRRQHELEARRKEEERQRLEYVNKRRREAATAFEQTRELYRETVSANLCGKPPVKKIIAQVAADHGLAYRDLVGPDQRRYVVAARDEAIEKVKLIHQLSMPRIGAHFGDRDHTTILMALRRRGLHGGLPAIERRREKDAARRLTTTPTAQGQT